MKAPNEQVHHFLEGLRDAVIMQLEDRVKGVRSLLERVLTTVHAYDRYPVQMTHGVPCPIGVFEIHFLHHSDQPNDSP